MKRQNKVPKTNHWSQHHEGSNICALCMAVPHLAASLLWLLHFTTVQTGRIPGTGEPGGLPSMGSHRVGHDWSDLAAADWVKTLFLLEVSHERQAVYPTFNWNTSEGWSLRVWVHGVKWRQWNVETRYFLRMRLLWHQIKDSPTDHLTLSWSQD